MTGHMLLRDFTMTSNTYPGKVKANAQLEVLDVETNRTPALSIRRDPTERTNN